MNPAAAGATSAGGFPNGSVFVMENGSDCYFRSTTSGTSCSASRTRSAPARASSRLA